MLELDRLSVNYGPVCAVADLSLQVGSENALAILGPNGAGKTSTLRAISGLVAHQGEIRLDGKRLSGRPAGAVTRSGVIQVPEGRRIFGSLTVEENLRVGTVAARRRDGRFRISDVYDLLPALVKLRGRSGWALSGGEQQMLAIGRALVASPEVLLLDEPSLGLAPSIVERIYATFKQLKGSVALVLVEQTAARALEIADEIVVLRDGECVGRGAAAEFSDQSKLARMMLGVAEDFREPEQASRPSSSVVGGPHA
jgi:branched-chain amino acid transport system ATP-binding protein